MDTIFKGVVTTLGIGSLATLIGWKVAQQIEVFEKRQAVRVLQNKVLQSAVDTVSVAFLLELRRAHQNALVKTPECRTLLNAYSVRLTSEKSFVAALADLSTISPLNQAIEATDALVSAASSAGDVQPKIAAFSTEMRDALTALAKEFR